jgi:hypothetical protein
MKAWTGSRFIRPVAIGLAVGAILAPGAQAQNQPYGELYQRHSVTPYGELYQHQLATPYSALYQYGFLPDGTPVSPLVTEPESTAVPVSETPAAYGELYQNPSAGLVTPTASGGMDWTDAGIGAGMALGVLVLAAAAALGLRRRGLAHTSQV